MRRWARTVAVAGTFAVGAGCAGNISTQQEVQLGQRYAAQINRELPIIQNQALHYYINQLGSSIARQVDPRQLDYQFYLVHSDVINAFAVPGGHVYITTGLANRTDNMSELAGVLSHEIAHVVERHSVENMAKQQQAQLGLTLGAVLLGRAPSQLEQTAVNVGGSAVFAKYSRDAEREADRDAVLFMMQAGIDPRGLLTFFEELLREEQKRPGQLAWFATHPGTTERIQNVQQDLAKIPATRLRGLTANTQAYQEFKARVRQLPPAPPQQQRR
jgi:predicted Zn-dependent protease